MRDALYNGKSGIVYDPVRKEMGQEAHPDTYIEVLVNNAGIRKDSLLLWMEQEDWSKVLGTGLYS